MCVCVCVHRKDGDGGKNIFAFGCVAMEREVTDRKEEQTRFLTGEGKENGNIK